MPTLKSFTIHLADKFFNFDASKYRCSIIDNCVRVYKDDGKNTLIEFSFHGSFYITYHYED